MGWADAISAGFDDARRRLEAFERSASETVAGAKETATKVATAVTERAADAVSFGAEHAENVVSAAQNAVSEAATSATPNNARASFGLPPSPMRGGTHPKAEAPPPDEPPANEAGNSEWLRKPSGHEWAALGTGFASGMAAGCGGPLGMALITLQDAAVEKYATPEDLRAYGTGESMAGTVHAALGIVGIVGGTGMTGGTGGGASAISLPMIAVGTMEAVSGGFLVLEGQSLAAKGAAKAAKAPAPPPKPTPPAAKPTPPLPADKIQVDADHILDGEVKNKGGTNVAQGYHLESGDVKTARIVDGTKSKPDARGVYTAQVQVQDANGTWITKSQPSTFFPENWTPEQAEREIREAYANSGTVDAGGAWTGKSSSGMTIKGYVDRPTRTRITTAYPVKTR